MRRPLLELWVLTCVVSGLSAGATAWAQDREPADLGGLAIPWLSSPGCQAIPYQAVAAYKQPAGQVIGQVVLDHPEWAMTATDSCDARPQIQLAWTGQAPAPLLTREIAYEHAVPAVFAHQTQQGSHWYQVRDERGRAAWLAAPTPSPWRYLSLESDLVQGLARLPETCTPQGRCTATPAALQTSVEQAGAARPGCAGNAYDIVGPVIDLPGGRRAYRVSLAPELRAAWRTRLPAEAVVPTYDHQGHWTGLFFARGC
jgi:hypothetical protein